MTLTDDRMYQALVEKDKGFDGIFYTGVKTTGIFCRPTCTARKPKRENVEFFPSSALALQHGYRACKVCAPLLAPDATPDYITALLDEIHAYPHLKIKDYGLRQRGIEPAALRRWFKKHHGITFHAYQRMLRINIAFKKIQKGESVTAAAFDSGYDSLSGFQETFKTVTGMAPSVSRNGKVIDQKRIETPLGPMFACASEKGICLLEFTDRRMLETQLKTLSRRFKAPIVQGENPHFETLETQLKAYFAGERTTFELPMDLPGTDFQQAVWEELQNIPYGKTRSYQEQAIAIRNPNAVRAVARANGENRIAIIIPCHRVIGKDGHLTGYGGGLWRKQWLLDLERGKLPS